MSKLLITFKSDPVTFQQAYPVEVDEKGKVLSGLGPDDGSHLVGYGPREAWNISVLHATRPQTEDVKGLVPTFSDGKGLFKWDHVVREVSYRD